MIVPLLVGLALLGSGYRDRYPLPTGVVPDGWGVNIHFTEPKTGEMEAIHAAGFRWVRMDLLWNAVERRKGVYDFREYDGLMGHLERVGIRPMFILCYGNALYQDGAPTQPHARRAFAQFVTAAVARYKGRGVIWEMWNEPNVAKFWQPHSDPQQYVTLARETGAALRRAGPEEWWVGPAVSRFDWPFLTACFEAGLLEEWDAVTVHPYRQTPPETVGPDWAMLQQLMRRYGREKPILSGEWGYSDRFTGFDRDKQANYAVRQYVANLVAGVPMSIWYDWRDDGQNPTEIEHHFGTVAFDGTPKPAYQTISALARALDGRRFLRALSDKSFLFSGTSMWVLERSGEELVGRPATPNEAGAVRIPWPSSPWRIAGEDEVRIALERALEAAPRGGTLTVSAGGRTLEVGGRSLTVGARTVTGWVGRDKAPHWLTVTAGGRPVWAGWAGSENPLSIELVPLPARDTLEVRIEALGASMDESLDVEVTIGTRVLRTRVTLRNGRATAEFPLYTWEQRSTMGARVNGMDATLATGLDPAHRQPLDLLAPDRWTARAEGDAAIHAEASLRKEKAEPGGPSGDALKLTYAAAKGWRYIVLADRNPVDLPGTPAEMFVWVMGDASGDALRMRFVDASGQTFQPHHGPIDWMGWRRVRFSLRGDQAGFWGGAMDGVVHGPIRITVPVLVDLEGRAGAGSIQIAGIVVVGAGDETR